MIWRIIDMWKSSITNEYKTFLCHKKKKKKKKILSIFAEKKNEHNIKMSKFVFMELGMFCFFFFFLKYSKCPEKLQEKEKKKH